MLQIYQTISIALNQYIALLFNLHHSLIINIEMHKPLFKVFVVT